MKFKPFDEVEIYSTSDPQLDGKIVFVVGVSEVYDTEAFYIITHRNRGEMFYNGYPCLVLTEHCLRKVI